MSGLGELVLVRVKVAVGYKNVRGLRREMGCIVVAVEKNGRLPLPERTLSQRGSAFLLGREDCLGKAERSLAGGSSS
uniref:RCK C-terminal domain-containing protein n=1 Tax=Fervidicoccus fontis TaxID=683846 RepID=A0A7J3ZLW0_9CREN